MEGKMDYDSANPGKRSEEATMGLWGNHHGREGKIGWILLWLLGVPLPILFALFLLRGCT